MALLDGTHAPAIKVYLDATNRSTGIFTLDYSLLDGSDVLSTGPYVPFSTLIQLPTIDVKSVSIRRGRTREDQTFQAGELTLIMDNLSGDYDPQMNISTYQGSDGKSILCGRTGIRVTATWSNTEYVIYTGYIEEIILEDGFSPTVQFICTDAISQLSLRSLRYTNDGNTYDKDSINSVLTTAGWPAAFRDTSSYQQVMAENVNVFDTAFNICTQIAAMQLGKFFINRLGEPTFLPFADCFGSSGGIKPIYRMLLSDQRPPSNATDIEYDAINISGGEKYIVNSITINNTTGDVTDVNSASVSRYGAIEMNLPGYFYFSSDAKTYAHKMSTYWGSPSYRCETVEFDGYGLTGWYDILQTEIGDGAYVQRKSVYRTSKNYNCLVESISHDITPDSWRMSFNFSPDSL